MNALDVLRNSNSLSIPNLSTLIKSSTRPLRVHVYGNNLDTDSRFWQTLATVSGGMFIVIKNSAVGGYKSEQILAKMQAEGFEPTADVVVFGEGTNDAMHNVLPHDSVSNMAKCISLIRNAQKIPLVRLPPPSNKTWHDKVCELWLCYFLMCEKLNVYAWDAYAKYANTDGNWITGFSSDGTNPNHVNYSIVGSEGWDTLTSRSRPYLLPKRNDNDGLITTNVLQTLDSNSDHIPDGWNINGINTHTASPLTDYAYPFRGKKCSLNLSGTTVNTLHKDINTGFNSGDTLRLTGVFACSDLVNCNVTVYLRASGGSGNLTEYAVYTASGIPDSFINAEIIVPENTTLITLYVKASSDVAGTHNANVSFGCLQVKNITTNTLI